MEVKITEVNVETTLADDDYILASINGKLRRIKSSDYKKLIGGSANVVVDSALSKTSLNPVQNKVVTEEINQLKESIANGGISYEEPMNDDIPKVFFEGDTSGMTKDNEKILSFSYKSKTTNFDGYVKMKWQGSSSLSFPKKNFTIKMFSDESCETKMKKSFKDWNHDGNKYVLKANYIDHTHARNIITANLWTEIIASRPDYESLPIELRNSPKNGAIDGFPIKLYLNGKYEGIYTWNIGKDDWMFGMDEDNPNHAVLCAEKNNNGNSSTTDRNILACEFRANANIDENDWSLEVPDTLNASIKTSFNNLINCVKDTDDETFKATIGSYLDVTSALDYYILVYFSCAVDNLGKNLIMMTYDGVKWFCSAYDLDNIWGSRGTNTFVDGTFKCPESYQETNSLLWQRIEKCFAQELYDRYKVIRKKVLSYSNVIDKFERFCDLIGTELYAEDVTIYTGIPYASQNNLKQIRNFFTPRANYVDACFEEFVNPNPEEPDTPVEPDEPDTPIEPDEPTTYTVTNTLTNATNDNSSTSVEENTSYTANIVPNADYTLNSVTVTMGGIDVTGSVYNNGVINISNVTGNIVIVAIAYNENMSVSMIPTSLNFSGFSINTETGYCSMGASTNAPSFPLNLVTVKNLYFTSDEDVYIANTTEDVVSCVYNQDEGKKYIAFKVKQELLNEVSIKGFVNYLIEKDVKIVWAFDEEPIDTIPVRGYTIGKNTEGFEVVINDKSYNSTENKIVSEIGLPHSIIDWQGNRYFKFYNYNDTLERIQSVKDELYIYVFRV